MAAIFRKFSLIFFFLALFIKSAEAQSEDQDLYLEENIDLWYGYDAQWYCEKYPWACGKTLFGGWPGTFDMGFGYALGTPPLSPLGPSRGFGFVGRGWAMP